MSKATLSGLVHLYTRASERAKCQNVATRDDDAPAELQIKRRLIEEILVITVEKGRPYVYRCKNVRRRVYHNNELLRRSKVVLRPTGTEPD
jgi:hypothetical protein